MNLDALEAAAKAATPGWPVESAHRLSGGRCTDCDLAEAYIVAADPQTVLALVAIARAAEDLSYYEMGGGFRAGHPEDLFRALRGALRAAGLTE